MKYVILIVLTSIGFVLSLHQYPAIENVYDTESNSEEVNEDVGHRIFKKSIKGCSPDFENLVKPEGAVQEPCRLTLPTLDLSAMETPQDPYSEDAVQEYLPTDVMPPRIPSVPYNPPFNNWTPYDLDYLAHVPASYNSYNMPYIYPISMPSVRSLPPVISTYIHETIPEEVEIDDGFDVNGLSDNDIYFPPYVRAVRSRDHDFLEQLQKDAIMPNLLPTMPFPYMRSASQPNYQTPLDGKTGPVAMFPYGSGSDCALPFLLSCTPKVNRGVLTQNVYGGSPTGSALATYRKGVVPSHVKAP